MNAPEKITAPADPRYDATREVRAPTGTQLACKS